MKKLITLLAVAGFVLALAPAAQAADVTVVNPSFELPELNDGTTGATPDDWTEAGHGDTSFTEGRVISYNYAGPTDGDQVLVLDDRSPWVTGPTGGTVSQSLGTGADLKALGSTLTATFDARKGGNLDQNAPNMPYTIFKAYFTVAGVKDTSDDVTQSHEDGVGLRKKSEIFADTGLNMDQYTVTMPTAGMGDSDDVQFVFEIVWEADGVDLSSGSSRTFIDNVVVTADGGGGGATPGTLIYGK